MESISSSMNKYWRRRRGGGGGGYRRLNGSSWWRRKRDRVEHLGDTTATRRRRRRRWRVKISPKIKISRIPSPKKMLLWLRDAYVRMMLGLANSKMMGINASSTGFGGMTAPASIAIGELNRPKEYDEKMIIHIYKSLMMNKGQLVPRHDDAAAPPQMVVN